MYEVEKIVTSRINKKGKRQYLIKWVGYDSSQNTWQPEKNLVNVQDLLRQFQRKEQITDDRKGRTRLSKINQNPYEEEKFQGFQDQNFDNEQQSQNKSTSVHKLQQSKKSKGGGGGGGAPPSTSPIKKQKKSIKILGMNDIPAQGFIYKIQIEGKTQWVKRNFFFPDYTIELIEFYQTSILFKKS